MRAAAAILCASLALGCGESIPARESIIVNTLTQADMPHIRSRRELVAVKYRTMGDNFYSYFRGTFPLYLRDATDTSLTIGTTAFPAPGVLPVTIGDAHPENFGLLVASDGTFAIEANDFDGADRYPHHWELRRFVTGLALTANIHAPEATRAVATDAALAYGDLIIEMSQGRPPPRLTIEQGDNNPIVADLFDRGMGDWVDREELDELTVLEGGVRSLLRGNIDPDDPGSVYLDVPDFVMEALPETIASYRETLIDPPPPQFFTLIDAARELGSGVASLARVRIILLVRGQTDSPDDDVILELKELTDSGAPGFIAAGVSYNNVQERVVGAARLLWARPDAEPLWGWSTLVGFPVQIKHESEGLKTFRTRRFTGVLSEPNALRGFARTLGRLLARMHAASGEEGLDAIRAAIGRDLDDFAQEHAEAGMAYAEQLERDWRHFQNALVRLGPVLGVPPDPNDRTPPELRELYGLSK